MTLDPDADASGRATGPLAHLDRAITAFAAVGMAAMSIAIFVQVVMRYVFGTPISWAEELAGLLFTWVIFLGAAHVQASDSHLSIDPLRRVAGPTLAFALSLVRLLVIGACGAVLVVEGIGLSERTWMLLYPAMGVTRGLLYASVPVCFAIGLIFVAAHLVRLRVSARAGHTGDEVQWPGF